MFKKTLYSTVAVLAAFSIVGCELADTPTSPQFLPPDSTSNSLLGGLTSTVLNLASSLLVSCDKLPTQSASQVIGPNGGRITVGPHTLVIPSGALSKNTLITAQLPGDKVSSVRFSPEGLQFNKPATLTMSYAHCRRLLPIPMRVVYTTEKLKVLELLGSLDNMRSKTVTTSLKHFSRYAVAYRNTEEEGDDEVCESNSDDMSGCSRSENVY